MPKAEDTQVIVELTHHAIHALRAVKGTVDAGGECALDNKPGVGALLDSIAPARKSEGLKAAASLWPDSVTWYLSSDTEAMLDRTPEALRAIAAANLKDPRTPLAFVVCNAGDGGHLTPDGTEKWIMAFSPRDSLVQALATLPDLKVDARGSAPAAFAMIGAVSAALLLEGKGGAVALWDLGADRSTVILVTAKGVEAVAPCSVSMETIVEAVQSVLKLKFRGAGARLFFNEGYDFTDPGPKVGAIIAEGVKQALGLLPPSQSTPALACFGLTGKQAWFIREVAAAVGTSPWEPDLGKLAAEKMGLKFSDKAVSGSFSAASTGLLELLGMRMRVRDEWNPEWIELGPAAEEAAPAPVPEAEPEAAPPQPAFKALTKPNRPKPSLAPEPGAAPAPPVTRVAKPAVPKPGAAAPLAAPLPGAPRPAAPAPHSPSPAFPPQQVRPPAPPAAAAQPSYLEPADPSRPSPFSNPGFQVPSAPAQKPAAIPPLLPVAPAPAAGIEVAAPAGATPPPLGAPPAPIEAIRFDAMKLRPLSSSATASGLPGAKAPAKPRSRVGFYIGIAAAAALVFALIAYVVEAKLAKTNANYLQQQEALAHQVAEERLKKVEQGAKEDAAKNRQELEAAIELTKKQTNEETRRTVLAEVEAQRLATVPGSLVVATVPAGASVSIDGGAPFKTPGKADGVAAGNHHVLISLDGYEPVELTALVKGSKVTDLGSVTLESLFGSVALSSSPDGLEFAIRPADSPGGKPVRAGRTPATIDDIPQGDYLVTFSRPGCRDHVGKLTVEQGVKSKVETEYVDGALELLSEPSGATVSKDGMFLGTTPLVLRNLTPKTAAFDLTLPGYDSTPISCVIPEGDTLKFSAQLLRKDRIFKESEVKTMPESYDAPPPVLSASQRQIGADVLLSLVVRRDGTVGDVQVVRYSDDDIARRCKMAVEKWMFRPATAPDDRTVDVRIEMPIKIPAASQ